MAEPLAFGATFQISTQNVNAQDGSAVAVLRDGRIAVVWKDTGTNTGDIKLQILNSDGTPAGAEITVNATTTGQQTRPAITALPDGGFVVGWTSFASDGNGDVAYRTFDATGAATMASDGAITNTAGYQQDISLVALTGGHFAIGWNDGNTMTTGLGSSTAAMLREFDGAGAVAGDIRLSGTTGGDWGPVLAFDGSQLLTAWDDSGSDGIFTRTLAPPLPGTDFTNDGTRVDTGPVRESSNDPDVALTGAGPVVVWDDVTTGTVGRDIYVSVNGTVSRVNTSTSGDQAEAAVAGLDTGGFVVVWRDLSVSGGSDIRARVYDESGVATSADFLVTEAGTASTGSQFLPDVACLVDGRFIVTWSDERTGHGIDGRIFDPRTAAILFFGTGDGELVFGTGFTPGDTIWGFDGDDTLMAMGGDDMLRGDGGNNRLDGGRGTDTADYSTGADAIDVTLRGGSYANLFHGTQTDRLRNVENLWGSAQSDRLIGDDRVNQILGNDGSDLIDGGLGVDVLSGGGMADTFRFSTAVTGRDNRDDLTDFKTGVDRIALKASVFAALGGSIAAGEFVLGSAAVDGNDFLIYNAATRVLSYDADGNGLGNAAAICHLNAGATLVFADLGLF